MTFSAADQLNYLLGLAIKIRLKVLRAAVIKVKKKANKICFKMCTLRFRKTSFQKKKIVHQI